MQRCKCSYRKGTKCINEQLYTFLSAGMNRMTSEYEFLIKRSTETGQCGENETSLIIFYIYL